MSQNLALKLPPELPADFLPAGNRPGVRWRPGMAAKQGRTIHAEVFSSGQEACGAGMALALALDDWRHGQQREGEEGEDRRAVLWVQDRAAVRLGGRPYWHGLPSVLRGRVVHALAETPEDALFALEEGVRCRDLAFVIGEIAGNPRVLDFTVSRRLTLAAQRHGVPLWLVRLDAARDLSSARMRWEVGSAPSSPSEWNVLAPGNPCWRAELFRSRLHPPGTWKLEAGPEALVSRKFSEHLHETPRSQSGGGPRRIGACIAPFRPHQEAKGR